MKGSLKCSQYNHTELQVWKQICSKLGDRSKRSTGCVSNKSHVKSVQVNYHNMLEKKPISHYGDIIEQRIVQENKSVTSVFET